MYYLPLSLSLFLAYLPNLHILYTTTLLQIITSSSFALNDTTAKELTEMAHQGIKLLTSWTTAVMELV